MNTEYAIGCDLLTEGNVHRIELDGREILLVGTAHVSKKSAEEVKELIEAEKPDTVCVELCPSRYQSISDVDRWKNTNLVKVIKEGKAMLLLVNIILSSYQKRMANQFGINPGQEMIQGIASARETGAELCLADRDIQTTMMRLWRRIGLGGKFKLFFELFFNMAAAEEINEEELEKMKSQDMLTAALNEISESFPQFKSILIDERDQYLAQKIKEAPGEKVIAILGAGHIPGIKQEIVHEHNLDRLSLVPPAPRINKVIAWALPALIIALVLSTFSVDRAAGVDQMMSWIIWNGTLAALGTLLAFGHPLSILTAFVASPISSLSPLIAAGWFAGLIEALVRKPDVKDFEAMADDLHSVRGFWTNKVTHILLVVVLANLGSSIGAMVGGADIIRQFIQTFI